MVALSFVALSVGLLLPSPSGTLTLTRRDALAAVAATPALLARPAAAPAATAYVPAKDIESIKVSSTYSLTYLRSTGPIHTTHYYLGYHGYTHRRSPGKRRRSRLRCAPPRRAGGSLPWTRRPASTTTRPPPKRCGARTLATPAAPACRAPRTVTRPTLRHCPGSIGAHADKLPVCR